MVFEGSEKKIEIVVSKSVGDLRLRGRAYWEEVVSECSAEIISEIKNDDMIAYLLSESSLFVWNNSILMITCGKTSLVNSLLKFIKDFGVINIENVIFQRKNEYYSHLQCSNFYDDLELLKNYLPGNAWRLGELDGHHNFIFYYEQSVSKFNNDKTLELLMYNLSENIGNKLRCENINLTNIRQVLGIENIFNDYQIDDYLFSPFGYSVNGIKRNRYFTIHLTPEKDGSYVSFETNDDQISHDKLVSHFIEKLDPKTFDTICFNLPTLKEKKGQTVINKCVHKISSNMNVSFAQHINNPVAKTSSSYQLL
jgi:S-adenosylmethionine decarboxylase